MNNLHRLFLATVCLLTFAAPAPAASVQIMAETPKAQQASIVYLGKPIDCKIEICPKEEAVEEPKAKGGALVDAFGMPSKMPTVIRGGQSSDDVVIAAPAPVQTSGSSPAAAPASASKPSAAEKSAPPPPPATAKIK